MSFDLTPQIVALINAAIEPLTTRIAQLEPLILKVEQLEDRVKFLLTCVEPAPEPEPEPAPAPSPVPGPGPLPPVIDVAPPIAEGLVTTHAEAKAHRNRHLPTYQRQKEKNYAKPDSLRNASDYLNIAQQARRSYLAAFEISQPNLVKLLTEYEAEQEFYHNTNLSKFYENSRRTPTQQNIRLKSLTVMSNPDIRAEVVLLTSYLEEEKSGFRGDTLQAAETVAKKFHHKKSGEVAVNSKWGQDNNQIKTVLAFLRNCIYGITEGDTFENKRVADLCAAINERLRTFERSAAPITFPLNGHVTL